MKRTNGKKRQRQAAPLGQHMGTEDSDPMAAEQAYYLSNEGNETGFE